jgi:hypothetical protein
MQKAPMSVLSAAHVDRAQEFAESVDDIDRERAEIHAMCAVALALVSISEELGALVDIHAKAHGLVGR